MTQLEEYASVSLKYHFQEIMVTWNVLRRYLFPFLLLAFYFFRFQPFKPILILKVLSMMCFYIFCLMLSQGVFHFDNTFLMSHFSPSVSLINVFILGRYFVRIFVLRIHYYILLFGLINIYSEFMSGILVQIMHMFKLIYVVSDFLHSIWYS